jgi:hypothetical protein
VEHKERIVVSVLMSVFAPMLVSVFACANPGMPPGGPERHTPPVVTSITPDTNATHVTPHDVRITFDEVISERPSGTATKLGDLVLVSPRTGDVNVDWHRDNITIRPDKGWRANTTYTVTMLPGVVDLRGNIRKEGVHLTFSTGDSIVHSAIRGVVFDWLNGRPVVNAVVEAVPVADSSAIYFAVADSLGRFSIRAPGATQYTVRASANTTQDHIFDSRMAYDSVHVALNDSAVIELLTFVHDSLGPRLTSVQVMDSVTLRASFGAPIDPKTPLDTAQFTLLASDSSHVPILAVRAANQDTTQDTTRLGNVSRTDTMRADTTHLPPRDTLTVMTKPSKPLLIQNVIITLGTPLRPKSEYRLETRNLRGPNGVALSSDQTFTTPEPPPQTPADTTHNAGNARTHRPQANTTSKPQLNTSRPRS